MVTLNAHFDGKVIVPDEPLILTPNQKLRITIETGELLAPVRTNFTEWVGLIQDGKHRPYTPSDEDALWEQGPLADLADRDA